MPDAPVTHQMHPLSCRIPADDFQWLASLPIEGAKTPSDKLRALIAQMRRQHQGTLDYGASVAWLRDMVAPFVAALREVENRHRMHSAAINAVIEWVPTMMATMVAERRFPARDPEKRAREIEEVLVERSVQLAATLMRLGVTSQADCYDPNVLERHLPKVVELAQIIHAERQRKDK